ncbi:MAG: hypothetical protein QM503_01560 [Bacteroidota bacterium]
MRKILFKEEQKFGSPSLYISMGFIYAIPTFIFLYAFYQQFVLKVPFGNEPISDNGLLIMAFSIFAVLIGSAYLLFGSKLITVVNSESILITFKPLTGKKISFAKSEIEKFEIREYKPTKEYGGYGVKQGKKRIGKAYNVSGKIGLQLYLKDGKKVLVGTQRGDALLRAMNKMIGK